MPSPIDGGKQLTKDTRQITMIAILTSLALIAHFLEAQLPPLFPALPVRLGLANIFTLIALLLFGSVPALLLTVIRCTLGPILGGSPTGMIYSLTGGLLSWAAMALLLPLVKDKKCSPVGVSVAGSFCFNMGQIAAGMVMLGSAMAAYLPILGFLSVPTGMFTGYLAMFLEKRLAGFINSDRV